MLLVTKPPFGVFNSFSLWQAFTVRLYIVHPLCVGTSSRKTPFTGHRVADTPLIFMFLLNKDLEI